MSTSRRFREAKKHQNHTAQAPSPRAENLERRLCRASLVLVDDFNVVGISASPHEADAPLTIDPDAVLTRS